jgi:hypothetical protein
MSNTIGKLVRVDSGDGKTVYTGIHVGDGERFSKIMVSTVGNTSYTIGQIVACPQKWVKPL